MPTAPVLLWAEAAPCSDVHVRTPASTKQCESLMLLPARVEQVVDGSCASNDATMVSQIAHGQWQFVSRQIKLNAGQC